MAVELELDFSRSPPHAGQITVIEDTHDHEVVVHSPGRRWGKSSCRPYLILDWISRGDGWVELAWGSQSHAEASEMADKDLLAFQPLGIVSDCKNDQQRRYIDFIPLVQHGDDREFTRNAGGRVWYPSLAPDTHSRFQGKGLWFAGIDEMSHVPTEAWEETIEPMLSDRGGHALIQGSPIPSGINFTGFSDLFDRGNPKSAKYDPRWHSLTGRSEENPWIDHAAVARKRKALIARGRAALASCLYDGIFASDLGAVFLNLDATFSVKPRLIAHDFWMGRDPLPDESVAIGIDFGRHDDCTIATAISRHNLEQLAVQRISQTEYPVQLPLLDAFLRRFPSRVVWAEGREEAAADMLRQRYGTGVNIVKWSASGPFDKSRAIARVMDLFERGVLKLLDVPFQRDEFRLFARKKMPSGRWEYNAPSGQHDDSVAAAAYALAYACPSNPVALPSEPRTDVGRPSAGAWEIYRRRNYAELTMTHPFILRRE